jgi:hypothetical protein
MSRIGRCVRRSLAGFPIVLLLAQSTAFAQRTVWVGVVVVYQAPADAIDWRGPWTRGMAIAGKTFYGSEAECRSDNEVRIARMHQGMKAPMRYRCVPFPESLP